MTKAIDTDISRRSILKAGLAIAAAGIPLSVRAQQKIAQSMVQYQETPRDGKECDQCAQFIAPGSCKVVDGKINPKGYCVAFTPKS